MDLAENFRSRIKLALDEKGMSMADLSRSCGKTQAWLLGVMRSGNPRYETLVDIAAALGVSPASLTLPVTNDECAGYGRRALASAGARAST